MTSDIMHTPSHTNVCKFFNVQHTFCQLMLYLKCWFFFFLLSSFSSIIFFFGSFPLMSLWEIFQISSPDLLLFIPFFAQNFNLIKADVNYSPSRNVWLDKNSEGKNKIVVVWVSHDLLAARSLPTILIRTVEKYKKPIQSIGRYEYTMIK